MTVVSMRKLLENGVHFGHQTRKWNPKMKPYIYTAKNGVYIIDLNKTEECLDKAYNALKTITENGGKVLFVGTKKQAQAPILEEAIRSGSFFVNQRWLGGTLTNFRTIQKSIKKLLEIEEMEQSGTINVYTKKEIAQLTKKKERLENFLGGIKEMKKIPDAVFVVDPTEEHNAVLEAKKLGIPVFALCDTNSNPDEIDFPIPSNDDAVRAVKLMITIMADAVVEAKAGVLSVAHQEDENAEDITMKDVMINVEEQAAENERRRRQRNEERRAKEAQRRPFSNNGDRRVFKKDAPAAAAATASTAEAVKTAVETKAEEVKADVKAGAEEAKAEVKKVAKKVKSDVEANADVQEAKAEVKKATKKVKADVEAKAEEVKADVEEKKTAAKKTVKKVAEEVKEDVEKAAKKVAKKAEDAE